MQVLLKTAKSIKPFSATIFLVLLISMPFLQANQIPAVCGIADQAPICNCCCCSHDSSDETAATEQLNGPCCCHIAEEEMPLEIPLEASIQPAQNTVSIPVVATSHPEEFVISTFVDGQRQLPDVDIGHGPPIYISISSLLI